MWCGIIDEYLAGSYVLQENLTGDSYANFMQNELSGLLEDLLLQTGVLSACALTPHLDMMQNLYKQLPDWWISHSDPWNWPSWSLDCTLQNFYVWGYMRNVEYECSVNWREEQLHWIFNAARHMNDPGVLSEVIYSVVK